jgi:aldehyde dehydrogenase (NAD+)
MNPWHQSQLLIGGRLVDATGPERYEVLSPFTEEVIGSVPVPTEKEIRSALESAREAFDGGPWPRMSPADRADALDRLALELRKREQESAEVYSRETGMPISSSPGMGRVTDTVLSTFADLARAFPFKERRPWPAGTLQIVKEPVGVVLSIAPWNGPVAGISHSLAPALAAGSTIVIKPAAEAPLAVHILSEAIVAAGFPPGVISILPGNGTVGANLCRQPEIDKIAFTGSTAVGKQIMTTAADRMVRVTLELGGKGPAVICEDADIESLAPAIVRSGLGMSGQVCAAQTRLLVPRAKHQEMVEALVAETKRLKLGDPMDPSTDLGPLTTARQRDRVENYLDIGRREGARIVIGGGRPAEFSTGWFIEPTIFVDVDNSMRIAQEEIFGPVLVVIDYQDDDDAVRLANASKYGLTGTVWSSDADRALRIARRMRCGQVHVNGFGTCPGQPFGGYKESGIGRKGGIEGLEAYLETKAIEVHAP